MCVKFIRTHHILHRVTHVPPKNNHKQTITLNLFLQNKTLNLMLFLCCLPTTNSGCNRCFVFFFCFTTKNKFNGLLVLCSPKEKNIKCFSFFNTLSLMLTKKNNVHKHIKHTKTTMYKKSTLKHDTCQNALCFGRSLDFVENSLDLSRKAGVLPTCSL